MEKEQLLIYGLGKAIDNLYIVSRILAKNLCIFALAFSSHVSQNLQENGCICDVQNEI